MSQAADCAALSTGFGIVLGSDCCTSASGLVQCTNDRITTINGGCNGNQPWGNKPFSLSLAGIDALNILFLDDCKMTGPLPDIFSAFTQMFELHIGGNQFSGSLPPSLGSVVGMQFLHFQNNYFTGTIPDSWRSMTNLQTVDDSGNCLVGPSPNDHIPIDSQKNPTDCTPPTPVVSSDVATSGVASAATTTGGASVGATTTGVAPASSAAAPASTTGAPVGAKSSSSVAAVVSSLVAPVAKPTTVAPTTSAMASTSSATAASDSNSGGIPIPLVAGAAGGGVLLLIIIGVSIWCCCAGKKGNPAPRGPDVYDPAYNHYRQDHEMGGYPQKQRSGSRGRGNDEYQQNGFNNAQYVDHDDRRQYDDRYNENYDNRGQQQGRYVDPQSPHRQNTGGRRRNDH